MRTLIVKINPDIPKQIADIFQNKYSSNTLCYQIQSDLTRIEINYLLKYFSERIFFELNEICDYGFFKALNPETIFDFEIINNEKQINSCSDLSMYYQFNDWIIVRNGIYDQSLKQNIGLFEAKIVDFFNDGEKDVFFIKWGENALNQISNKKIHSLIQNGISPFDTYINSDQVLPYRKQGTDRDLSVIHMEVFAKFAHKNFKEYWDDPENLYFQNNQQLTVVNWEHHFHEIFNKQKNTIATDYQNENIKINNTAGSDDKNGVWISIDRKGQELIIPLMDVKSILTPVFFKKDLKIYQYWASFFCQQ